MMSEPSEADLLDVSRRLARLDDNNLLIVMSNAIVQHCGYRPQQFLDLMANVMITSVATLREDDEVAQMVDRLRTMSDTLEAGYISKNTTSRLN